MSTRDMRAVFSFPAIKVKLILQLHLSNRIDSDNPDQV